MWRVFCYISCMTINEILTTEAISKTELHLYRERIFWVAYEKSAFLFWTHFKKYKVTARFYKIALTTAVKLGFPVSKLDGFIQAAIDRNCSVTGIGTDHIIIRGLPDVNGYEQWHTENSAFAASPQCTNTGHPTQANAYLFKMVYDLSQGMIKMSHHLNKNLKFSIGERIVSNVLDLVELASDQLNHTKQVASDTMLGILYRVQIHVRLLHDLGALRVKQWEYMSQMIQNVIDFIIPESVRSIFNGRMESETGVQPRAC